MRCVNRTSSQTRLTCCPSSIAPENIILSVLMPRLSQKYPMPILINLMCPNISDPKHPTPVARCFKTGALFGPKQATAAVLPSVMFEVRVRAIPRPPLPSKQSKSAHKVFFLLIMGALQWFSATVSSFSFQSSPSSTLSNLCSSVVFGWGGALFFLLLFLTLCMLFLLED